MANPFIAVRITPDLDAAIVKRIQETGQSKSDVVIEALKTYLGILPQAHRLAEIEQRLSALEHLFLRCDKAGSTATESACRFGR